LALLVSFLLVGLLVAGFFFYRRVASGQSASLGRFVLWLRDPSAYPEWNMSAGQRCGEAPFLFPTDGFVGFLWDDSFRVGHHHQGIDVFGGAPVGQTPVLAAYPGYLTRLPDWKSSLIIRIPQDPLYPNRQIWAYYTHMADSDGNSYISPDFPAGTNEVFVEAGTLLGFQGNYSGDPYNPTGVHLHFSIVKDDGQGSFLNELEIRNTLDPSPYLGYSLNANTSQGQVPVCPENSVG
jgi:murein DD-endopeptidase MepM/ murein hydrolase activator NlpD